MCFCGMALFPSKHATLINNCYPSQPGDFIPKSNELSYLQFYANSRPEKLTKVGVFLEKKIVSDLWKKRNDHVHVSLSIWQSLITTNPSQINLFADPFLKSIYNIISSNDLSLLPVATETLNVFYQVKGKHLINSDPEIADCNLKILNFYSDYATSENHDTSSKLSQRYYGIWGLLGISQSEESLSSDSKTYLERIVPSILANATKPVLEADKLDEKMVIPEDLKPPSNIVPDDINRLACFGIHQLLSGGSVIHVKTVMELILKYLDSNNVWGHEKHVTDVLQLSSNSVQDQFGYIPVAAVLRHFEANHPQNNNGSSKQEENLQNSTHVLKAKTLITALASLLSNRKSYVGISILEILNTLIMQLLIQEKVIHDVENHRISSEKCSLKDLKSLQTRTISSISSLGTHIYYSDQIIDILSFLTNKLKINSSTTEKKDDDIDHNRIVILKTMTEIIRQFHTQYPKMDSPPKCNLSLSILNPLFTLFTCNDPLSKFQLKEFLVELTNNLSFYSRMGIIHDIEFVNSLNQNVYQYVRSIQPSNWIDLVIIFQILEVLYPAFGDNGLFSVIPLLFKFQDMDPDVEDVLLYKHTLLHNLVNVYFDNLGIKLSNQELREYTQSIHALKQANNQWIPNLYQLITDPALEQKWDLPLEHAISYEAGDVEKGESLNLSRGSHLLDRQKIISIILNDPTLKPNITKDVKIKLYQDYNPDKAQLEFQQSKYRIRSSTTFRTKSKPNSPKSPAGVPNINLEPVKVLKVESLKEALNPLYATEGSSDMDSDSDIQATSLYNSRRSPRDNSRADVNSLLKTINGSQTTGRRSNISLVNGPNYPYNH